MGSRNDKQPETAPTSTNREQYCTSNYRVRVVPGLNQLFSGIREIPELHEVPHKEDPRRQESLRRVIGLQQSRNDLPFTVIVDEAHEKEWRSPHRLKIPKTRTNLPSSVTSIPNTRDPRRLSARKRADPDERREPDEQPTLVQNEFIPEEEETCAVLVIDASEWPESKLCWVEFIPHECNIMRALLDVQDIMSDDGEADEPMDAREEGDVFQRDGPRSPPRSARATRRSMEHSMIFNKGSEVECVFHEGESRRRRRISDPQIIVIKEDDIDEDECKWSRPVPRLDAKPVDIVDLCDDEDIEAVLPQKPLSERVKDANRREATRAATEVVTLDDEDDYYCDPYPSGNKLNFMSDSSGEQPWFDAYDAVASSPLTNTAPECVPSTSRDDFNLFTSEFEVLPNSTSPRLNNDDCVPESSFTENLCASEPVTSDHGSRVTIIDIGPLVNNESKAASRDKPGHFQEPRQRAPESAERRAGGSRSRREHSSRRSHKNRSEKERNVAAARSDEPSRDRSNYSPTFKSHSSVDESRRKSSSDCTAETKYHSHSRGEKSARSAERDNRRGKSRERANVPVELDSRHSRSGSAHHSKDKKRPRSSKTDDSKKRQKPEKKDKNDREDKGAGDRNRHCSPGPSVSSRKENKERSATSAIKKNEERTAASVIKKDEERTAASAIKKNKEGTSASAIKKNKERTAASAIKKNKERTAAYARRKSKWRKQKRTLEKQSNKIPRSDLLFSVLGRKGGATFGGPQEAQLALTAPIVTLPQQHNALMPLTCAAARPMSSLVPLISAASQSTALLPMSNVAAQCRSTPVIITAAQDNQQLTISFSVSSEQLSDICRPWTRECSAVGPSRLRTHELARVQPYGHRVTIHLDSKTDFQHGLAMLAQKHRFVDSSELANSCLRLFLNNNSHMPLHQLLQVDERVKSGEIFWSRYNCRLQDKSYLSIQEITETKDCDVKETNSTNSSYLPFNDEDSSNVYKHSLPVPVIGSRVNRIGENFRMILDMKDAEKKVHIESLCESITSETNNNELKTSNNNFDNFKMRKRHSLPTLIPTQQSYSKRARSESYMALNGLLNSQGIKLKFKRDESNKNNWKTCDSTEQLFRMKTTGEEIISTSHNYDELNQNNQVTSNIIEISESSSFDEKVISNLNNDSKFSKNDQKSATNEISELKGFTEKVVPELDKNDFETDFTTVAKDNFLNSLRSSFLQSRVKNINLSSKTNINLKQGFTNLPKKSKILSNTVMMENKPNDSINITMTPLEELEETEIFDLMSFTNQQSIAISSKSLNIANNLSTNNNNSIRNTCMDIRQNYKCTTSFNNRDCSNYINSLDNLKSNLEIGDSNRKKVSELNQSAEEDFECNGEKISEDRTLKEQEGISKEPLTNGNKLSIHDNNSNLSELQQQKIMVSLNIDEIYLSQNIPNRCTSTTNTKLNKININKSNDSDLNNDGQHMRSNEIAEITDKSNNIENSQLNAELENDINRNKFDEGNQSQTELKDNDNNDGELDKYKDNAYTDNLVNFGSNRSKNSITNINESNSDISVYKNKESAKLDIDEANQSNLTVLVENSDKNETIDFQEQSLQIIGITDLVNPETKVSENTLVSNESLIISGVAEFDKASNNKLQTSEHGTINLNENVQNQILSVDTTIMEPSTKENYESKDYKSDIPNQKYIKNSLLNQNNCITSNNYKLNNLNIENSVVNVDRVLPDSTGMVDNLEGGDFDFHTSILTGKLDSEYSDNDYYYVDSDSSPECENSSIGNTTNIGNNDENEDLINTSSLNESIGKLKNFPEKYNSDEMIQTQKVESITNDHCLKKLPQFYNDCVTKIMGDTNDVVISDDDDDIIFVQQIHHTNNTKQNTNKIKEENIFVQQIHHTNNTKQNRNKIKEENIITLDSEEEKDNSNILQLNDINISTKKFVSDKLEVIEKSQTQILKNKIEKTSVSESNQQKLPQMRLNFSNEISECVLQYITSLSEEEIENEKSSVLLPKVELMQESNSCNNKDVGTIGEKKSTEDNESTLSQVKNNDEEKINSCTDTIDKGNTVHLSEIQNPITNVEISLEKSTEGNENNLSPVTNNDNVTVVPSTDGVGKCNTRHFRKVKNQVSNVEMASYDKLLSDEISQFPKNIEIDLNNPSILQKFNLSKEVIAPEDRENEPVTVLENNSEQQMLHESLNKMLGDIADKNDNISSILADKPLKTQNMANSENQVSIIINSQEQKSTVIPPLVINLKISDQSTQLSNNYNLLKDININLVDEIDEISDISVSNSTTINEQNTNSLGFKLRNINELLQMPQNTSKINSSTSNSVTEPSNSLTESRVLEIQSNNKCVTNRTKLSNEQINSEAVNGLQKNVTLHSQLPPNSVNIVQPITSVVSQPINIVNPIQLLHNISQSCFVDLYSASSFNSQVQPRKQHDNRNKSNPKVVLASSIFTNVFDNISSKTKEHDIYTLELAPLDTLQLPVPFTVNVPETILYDYIYAYKKMLLSKIINALEHIKEVSSNKSEKFVEALLNKYIITENTWIFQINIITILQCIACLANLSITKNMPIMLAALSNTEPLKSVHNQFLNLKTIVNIFQSLVRGGIISKTAINNHPLLEELHEQCCKVQIYLPPISNEQKEQIKNQAEEYYKIYHVHCAELHKGSDEQHNGAEQHKGAQEQHTGAEHHNRENILRLTSITSKQDSAIVTSTLPTQTGKSDSFQESSTNTSRNQKNLDRNKMSNTTSSSDSASSSDITSKGNKKPSNAKTNDFVTNRYLCEDCKKSSKLLCSRCKEVSYCSVECQKNHWTKEHHKSCLLTIEDI